MPYAENNGVRIHYQVEWEDPPLVLQHGFRSSLKTWYDYGYVDTLQQDYRLLLLDARGHGASDKPHEPAAYALEQLRTIVQEAEDIGWGYGDAVYDTLEDAFPI